MTEQESRVQPYRGTLQHTEYAWNTYGVIVREGVTLEDVLKPGFWIYTKGLRSFDVLKVISETGEWECELRVLGVRPTGPALRVLNEWSGLVPADRPSDGVEHLGGSEYMVHGQVRVSYSRVNKWRCIRVSDGQILDKDLDDKSIAIKQAQQYIQIAAKAA